MKRLIPTGFQETDEIVLSRGFDEEVEIQGRAWEPIGDDGNSTDDRETSSFLFKKTRDDPEYALEVQGVYPTTGNPCLGPSRPGSIPAASRSAASV